MLNMLKKYVLKKIIYLLNEKKRKNNENMYKNNCPELPHCFFSRSGNFGHHQVTQQSDLHFKMNSNNDNLKNQNASF